MAEQSFLNKMGMRLGILGSAASLAIAAPLATGNYDPTCHTDAARTGVYFDRTLGSEALGLIIGGNTGPAFTSATTVVGTVMGGGSTTVGTGAGSTSTILTGNAGTNRRLGYYTALSVRWTVDATNAPETGTNNAGSNFNIASRTDAGAVIANNFSINRPALSAITLARPTIITAGTLTGSQTALAMSATWNNVATTFTGFGLTPTATAAASTSLLFDFKIGGVSRFNQSGYSTASGYGAITSALVDDGTAIALSTIRASTITVGINDGNGFQMTTVVNGVFTVTRLNWFSLDNPAGSATITNATVFDFDAIAGTHKCLDAGTTKTTPGSVTAWIKHNINGTVYFSNAYTSKTS